MSFLSHNNEMGHEKSQRLKNSSEGIKRKGEGRQKGERGAGLTRELTNNLSKTTHAGVLVVTTSPLLGWKSGRAPAALSLMRASSLVSWCREGAGDRQTRRRQNRDHCRGLEVAAAVAAAAATVFTAQEPDRQGSMVTKAARPTAQPTA